MLLVLIVNLCFMLSLLLYDCLHPYTTWIARKKKTTHGINPNTLAVLPHVIHHHFKVFDCAFIKKQSLCHTYISI